MTRASHGVRPGPPARLPHATYRLQLHRDFTLDAAAALAGYLARLGVSDCYTSPIFRAAEGSTHGYDVSDHNEISPELGGADAYVRFSAALRQHLLGHIVDFVPNHMGILTESNLWWRDVLENGPCSVSARFFDIDWHPASPGLENKVLLPILGDQYGLTLERGELRLLFDGGQLELEHAGQRLPINPRQAPRVYRIGLDALQSAAGADDEDVRELQSILSSLQHLPPYPVSTPEAIEERQREKEVARARLSALTERSVRIRDHIAQAVTAVNGRPGDAASFDILHELLEAQPYRLASWRTAADEINYRRFFDINALAAVRVEDPIVFEAIHTLLESLIGRGAISGVRIDHPDGLFDPARYFADLQRIAGTAAPAGSPMYVLAEKVLSAGEDLPGDWQVNGTTGYGFVNDVTGLFVDGRHAARLLRTYQRFTGRDDSWRLICQRSKKLIMDTAMASELAVLSDALERLSRGDRRWRDFTRHSLRDALVALISCFPVYRTYITERGWSARDAEVIDEALDSAKRANPAVESTVLDFVRNVLLPAGAGHEAELRFAMKLQQYTAPVQAKGVEDTAFYRYNPLLALNEVGGDPSRVGRSVREFHDANLDRAARWPYAMNATATHDTKLGEDTRARIAAISVMLDDWQRGLGRWSRIARHARTMVHGEAAPDRNDEYRFYQVLAGTWPAEPAGAPIPSEASADLVRRLRQYMEKASREAKLHTSWISPNEPYDQALGRFVESLLRGPLAATFLPAFVPFARALSKTGAVNSLAQTLLKIGVPGVPDFYQGTELWDLTLVDPDNRRPVDFESRAGLAADLESLVLDARHGAETARPRVTALHEQWTNGHIKLFVTLAALGLRRQRPTLFLEGRYVPLDAGKAGAVAFARVHDDAAAIVAAPTLGRHDGWGDARVRLDSAVTASRFIDVLTGARIDAAGSGDARYLNVRDLFATLPVALLVTGPAV
ncbi:MAG: malto-oligosyltrehalose synthase [Acidobacteriota bacterium]|nr:malto-oligosyltrehalose synthase [Acidobacteriota bacterium]